MNTTLLTIEQQFLNSDKAKQMFLLKEAKKLQSAIETSDKKKFLTSVELAKVFHQAEQKFESDECKQLLTETGITWKKDEFFEKAFGVKKSFTYRLLKVAKLGSEKVEQFNEYVDEQRAQGEDVSRSLKTFIKWCKGEDVTAGGEEGAEGGEETEGKCILTLSFRRKDIDGGANISVRVKADGSLEGSTPEEIMLAIAYLQSKLA
jgi:hypothetical protein